MDEQMKQMIGQRIREERERRGMTLEELAQAVGVASRGQMSRFESGERGVDSMLLHRIAVALEVPMDAFFDAERGQVLAMGRAGEAQSEAMQRMADAAGAARRHGVRRGARRCPRLVRFRPMSKARTRHLRCASASTWATRR